MAKKYKKVPFDPTLLKKKPFLRAVTPNFANTSHSTKLVQVNEAIETTTPRSRKVVVSQDQLLSELDPRSHAINDRFKYPNKRIKEKREVDGTIVEYYRETEISRIALPLQSTIATRQCVHLFGKPPKFTSKITNDADRFMRFKEYWTEKSISAALYLMAKSALTTGDGAICFLLTDTGLNYKIWSYATGDQLIPVYKKNGIDMEMFIRRYWSIPDGFDNSVETIDIYREKTYQQLILDGKNWVEIIPETSHGFFSIPIAYHAEMDAAWGVGQELIETIELFLSNVREAGAYFDFGILFLKGDDVEVLPTKETQGKVIISQDPQGDAKMLEKTDMSQSLKFEFDQYTKQLYLATGTVIIDLELLKGGDQSGAYIKNLYNDAIQYAMDAKPRWQPVLDKIVSIVKEGLGLAEKDTLEYKRLVIIADPDIYVPMNIAEEVRLVNESLKYGAISIETAAQTNAFAAPDEVNRLNNQKIKENERTASLANNEIRDASGGK